MLTLQNHEAKLIEAKNEVTEKDDDSSRAIDLDFEMGGHNDLLLTLHNSLKTAFYRKPTKAELIESGQEDMELEDSHLPMLKFPDIRKPISWDFKSEGYQLQILQNLDPKQVYEEFEDCRVSGIKFLCKHGGHVNIRFRVRVVPNMAQVGRIFSIIKETRPINLVLPTTE